MEEVLAERNHPVQRVVVRVVARIRLAQPQLVLLLLVAVVVVVAAVVVVEVLNPVVKGMLRYSFILKNEVQG